MQCSLQTRIVHQIFFFHSFKFWHKLAYPFMFLNADRHVTFFNVKLSSSSFRLRHPVAPVCKPGQKRLYGVSRLESVSVRCELEADPADVTFHWRFNSSSSGKRLTLASYSNALTHSTAVYSPNGEDDFGFLLCWGSNEVGKQLRPCNFSVVPAGGYSPTFDPLSYWDSQTTLH